MNTTKVEDERSCFCHINPPCSKCVDERWECGECGKEHEIKEEAEKCCMEDEDLSGESNHSNVYG